MSIGKRITQERKKNNFTQEQLSNKIFVSRQSISKWEKDLVLPDIENIKQLSIVFNVSTDYLIYGKEISQVTSKLRILNVAILAIGIILFTSLVAIAIYNKELMYETSSIIKFNPVIILLIASKCLIIFGMILIYKSKRK